MTFQKKEDMWMYSNEKGKGKETPKERRHMDILNRKEKGDHLCISETFLMSRIPSFRLKIL